MPKVLCSGVHCSLATNCQKNNRKGRAEAEEKKQPLSTWCWVSVSTGGMAHAQEIQLQIRGTPSCCCFFFFCSFGRAVFSVSPNQMYFTG